MFSDALKAQAQALLENCRKRGVKIATAESCTGGLISGCLTEVAGSSDVVDRGFVTYSNEAKIELINVPAGLIEEFGAVSEDVARAMAEGALEGSRADYAVSVTGVAGPGGGTASKPVGLVHMACSRRDRPTLHERHVFAGDRSQVRKQTVVRALRLLDEAVTG